MAVNIIELSFAAETAFNKAIDAAQEIFEEDVLDEMIAEKYTKDRLSWYEIQLAGMPIESLIEFLQVIKRFS